MSKLFLAFLLGILLPLSARAIVAMQQSDGTVLYIWTADEMQKMDDALGALIKERDRLRAKLTAGGACT